jgi:hypothetical protein
MVARSGCRRIHAVVGVLGALSPGTIGKAHDRRNDLLDVALRVDVDMGIPLRRERVPGSPITRVAERRVVKADRHELVALDRQVGDGLQSGRTALDHAHAGSLLRLSAENAAEISSDLTPSLKSPIS